jgi:uncharacterized protein YdhG (YjbR/CyaY superfamily)
VAVPATVEEYLATLSPDRRAPMDDLRRTIRTAAPEAVETISYQMPSFRLDGRFFVSYAAYRRHYSLFPASEAVVEALGDTVRPYLSGRGTIRFDAAAPIPLELVRRIVEVRLVEHAAHARR